MSTSIIKVTAVVGGQRDHYSNRINGGTTALPSQQLALGAGQQWVFGKGGGSPRCDFSTDQLGTRLSRAAGFVDIDEHSGLPRIAIWNKLGARAFVSGASNEHPTYSIPAFDDGGPREAEGYFPVTNGLVVQLPGGNTSLWLCFTVETADTKPAQAHVYSPAEGVATTDGLDALASFTPANETQLDLTDKQLAVLIAVCAPFMVRNNPKFDKKRPCSPNTEVGHMIVGDLSPVFDTPLWRTAPSKNSPGNLVGEISDKIESVDLTITIRQPLDGDGKRPRPPAETPTVHRQVADWVETNWPSFLENDNHRMLADKMLDRLLAAGASPGSRI